MDTLASVYDTLVSEGFAQVAMLALMLYELLITLDGEVNLFWSAAFTKTTALFLLNRYMSLIKYPVEIAAMWPTSEFSCLILIRVGEGAEIIPYFVWTAFTVMRVHALTQGHWGTTILVFMLSSVPIGANIYLFTATEPGLINEVIGCTFTTVMPETVYTALLISSRTCAILSDVIVLGITWYRTIGCWREARSARIKVSLSMLLLRDSSIYFMILLSINIVYMVAAFTSVFLFFPALLGEPLNAIVISRMMLNLREVNQSHPQASNQDLFSLPSFVYGQGLQTSASRAEQTHVVSVARLRRSHDTVDDIVAGYRLDSEERLPMSWSQ